MPLATIASFSKTIKKLSEKENYLKTQLHNYNKHVESVLLNYNQNQNQMIRIGKEGYLILWSSRFQQTIFLSS